MNLKKTVVAIPVKNEADHVHKCLEALARQSMRAGDIILLLNNCTDSTAEVIRAAPQAASRVHVIECHLPQPFAGAGEARRLAMEHAAAIAEDGVLLTTDADGQVGPDWIAANLAALERGADAVCGQALIDPVDALMIPLHLHEDDAREVAYGRLLDEIAARLDPDPADPWPRHSEESGASIAVTMRMFTKVGGMPKILSGEDRKFIRSLRLIDARVRHAPEITVTVSGRIEGRADGGMADAIRRRMVQQDEFTDDRIEPAANAIYRIQTRQRARALWLQDNETAALQLAHDLALPEIRLATALKAKFFGTAWDEIEQASPRLARRRVAFADVMRETGYAAAFYRRVITHEPAREVLYGS